MKVHNLGNDYAYQRKQKQMVNQSAEKSDEKPTISEVIPETNAGDQVQSRGEREAMAEADTSAPKQKPKKKKETGTENEQPED